MSGYKVTEGHFAPAGKFAIRRDDFAVMGLAYTAETAALFAAAPKMLEALRTAAKTIRLWHDITPLSEEPEALTGWDEYLAGSPEMREITAAIALAEGRPQ